MIESLHAWNVVIGGHCLKELSRYTTYKMALVTREGLLVAIFLTSCLCSSCGRSSSCCLRGLSERAPTAGTDARLDSSRKSLPSGGIMNDLPDTRSAHRRLETLELRVRAWSIPQMRRGRPSRSRNSRANRSFQSSVFAAQASGMFPLLGKAMLGIAGATCCAP